MAATIHYLPSCAGRAHAQGVRLPDVPKRLPKPPSTSLALTTVLEQRRDALLADPEHGECYLCQHPRLRCVCRDERFIAARAIAVQEGRREEWKAVLTFLTGSLEEMAMLLEEDPFERPIDAWHEADGLDEDGQPVQLHEWLGLTRKEFSLYVACPEMAVYLHTIAQLRQKAHREEIDTVSVRKPGDERQEREQP